MITRRNFLQTAPLALAAASSLPLRGLAESPTAPGLKDLAPPRLLVGAVVDKWQMQDPRWLQLILANFNLITIGKLKWGYLCPSSPAFDFRETDWMVDFCGQHRLALHGHNLCWNSANPAWLTQTLTKANAERMLTDYIRTVMKRYAGRITSWDVVNEPIATWMGRPDGLYKGPWLDALGPQYIDVAFHAAAEADPVGLRVLNLEHVEQGGSGDDAARLMTLRLVESLLKRGVPIQAVGFESHLAGNYSVSSTPSRASFVRDLRGFGLQILLTEIDIDDTRISGDASRRDALVGADYADYLGGILREAHPSRVIFFSPSDQRNWYDAMHSPQYDRRDGAPHRPGLFDKSLLPKPAYASVASALKGYHV
jgi:endo-1,4-beta-xylanase